MLKRRYKYVGPVLEFNTLLTSRWSAETVASSETKAKSQLAYQFKQQYNRVRTARITLPGKLVELEQIME